MKSSREDKKKKKESPSQQGQSISQTPIPNAEIHKRIWQSSNLIIKDYLPHIYVYLVYIDND